MLSAEHYLDSTTLLRRYSEYLAGLCMEVTTTLSTLEQTLSEKNGTTAADPVGLVAEVANLQGRLCREAELFCQRLHVFVETTKPDNTVAVKN